LVDILHIGCQESEGWFHYVMELADSAAAASNQCSVVSDQSSGPVLK